MALRHPFSSITGCLSWTGAASEWMLVGVALAQNLDRWAPAPGTWRPASCPRHLAPSPPAPCTCICACTCTCTGSGTCLSRRFGSKQTRLRPHSSFEPRVFLLTLQHLQLVPLPQSPRHSLVFRPLCPVNCHGQGDALSAVKAFPFLYRRRPISRIP